MQTTNLLTLLFSKFLKFFGCKCLGSKLVYRYEKASGYGPESFHKWKIIALFNQKIIWSKFEINSNFVVSNHSLNKVPLLHQGISIGSSKHILVSIPSRIMSQFQKCNKDIKILAEKCFFFERLSKN